MILGNVANACAGAKPKEIRERSQPYAPRREERGESIVIS